MVYKAHQFDDEMLAAVLITDPQDPGMMSPRLGMGPNYGAYPFQTDGLVTMNEPEYRDLFTVRFSWSSNLDDPTYYLYRGDQLISISKNAAYMPTVDPTEDLVINVLDDALTPPERTFPGRFLLQWTGVTGVDYYRVDEFVASVWTERARALENGANYYKFQSRWLEDDTVHQFRVVAVGTNGNEATALSFSARMVRVPDVPEITYSYDSGTGLVTIDEA